MDRNGGSNSVHNGVKTKENVERIETEGKPLTLESRSSEESQQEVDDVASKTSEKPSNSTFEKLLM